MCRGIPGKILDRIRGRILGRIPGGIFGRIVGPIRRRILSRLAITKDSSKTYVTSHTPTLSLIASIPVLIAGVFLLGLLWYAPVLVGKLSEESSWGLIVLSALTLLALLSQLVLGLVCVSFGFSVTAAAIGALRHPTRLTPHEHTLEYSYYDAEKKVRRNVTLTPASILRCLVERRNTLMSEGGQYYWEPILHLEYQDGQAPGYTEVGGDRQRVDKLLKWLADHQVPLRYTLMDLVLVPFKQRPAALGNVPAEPLSYLGIDALMALFEKGAPVPVYYRPVSPE